MGVSEVSGTYRHDLSNYSNFEVLLSSMQLPITFSEQFAHLLFFNMASLPTGDHHPWKQTRCDSEGLQFSPPFWLVWSLFSFFFFFFFFRVFSSSCFGHPNHPCVALVSFGSVSTTIRADDGDFKLGRSFLVGAPVSDNWVGYLNYKSGLEDPGVVVGFTRRKKQSSFRISSQVCLALQLLVTAYSQPKAFLLLFILSFCSSSSRVDQIGEENTWVNVQGSYDVFQDTRLKANLIVGTPGVSLAVGAEKQVAEHSKIGFFVEVGEPQGVTVKFRYVAS